MRVPALIHWPAKVPSGVVDATPSQAHAWKKFLTAAAEGRYEPMKSLVYTRYEFPWNGATEAFREFKARKGKVRGLQQMVRVGDYVALRTRMREGPARTRLYNVARDPFEAHDLSRRPEEQTRLRALTAILDERRRP